MCSTYEMSLSNGERSTTTNVWETLTASKEGNLERLKALVKETPGLIYAQYNYTPPIHFAVREGHIEMVRYILEKGALDEHYITYPFKDSLLTLAEERGYKEIANILKYYLSDHSLQKYQGDNGEIFYNRTAIAEEFQKAVNKVQYKRVKEILQEHPDLAHDESFSWGEGILMMPSNMRDLKLIELLMIHGASVPPVSKWGRFYYFKHFKIAEYLIKNGMDPNHRTWHEVRLLHDMAQEGDIDKAKLLLDHGAEIDPIEEEYHSTPLGLASRWGYKKMVEYLLKRGADPNKAGKPWAKPLEWAKRRGHTIIEKMLREAGAE